jgi:hypothetical protein
MKIYFRRLVLAYSGIIVRLARSFGGNAMGFA